MIQLAFIALYIVSLIGVIACIGGLIESNGNRKSIRICYIAGAIFLLTFYFTGSMLTSLN